MELKKFFGADERTKRLRINSVIILICKGCTVLINLLYVPLLIDVMSQTNYGIWLTLSSIVSWLFVFDIGIGHGVRNKMSEALAEDNLIKARSILSTGYFVLIVIIFSLLLIVWCVFPFLNWAAILSAPSYMNRELTVLTVIVVSSFCFQLVLKLVDAVIFALQKPAIVSILVVTHQALSLLIIFLMKISGTEFGILQYGMVISLMPLIVIFIFSIVYFLFVKKELRPSYKLISKKYIHDVLGLGIKFFAIQLTAVILFQSNTLIIAHEVGQISVVDYNVAYKYFGVLLMIFTTITAPVWSASTEAFSKGDYGWILRTHKQLNKIYLVSIFFGGIMLILSPIAYKLWLSDEITIDWLLMILMLIYYILNIGTGIYASFINGSGKVTLQFYMTASECFIHIPLAIFLASIWGIYGVLTSMILVTAINLIWEPIQFKKLSSGNAVGIWNK